MKNDWEQVERGRFAASINGKLLEVIRNPDRSDSRRYIAVVDHKPVGAPAYNVIGAKSKAMHAAGLTSRPQKPKAAPVPSWAAKIQPDIDFEITPPELTVSNGHQNEQPDLDDDPWLGIGAEEEPEPEPAPEQPPEPEPEPEQAPEPAPEPEPTPAAAHRNEVIITLSGRLRPSTQTVSLLGQIEAAVSMLRDLAEQPGDVHCELSFPGGIKL